MGQGDVLKILEKSKDWMTAREVATVLVANKSLVGSSLKKLHDHNEIIRTETRIGRYNTYLYKFKEGLI